MVLKTENKTIKKEKSMPQLDLNILGNVQEENSLMVIINFCMCALLAFILRAFYVRYSTSLTGKNHIGTILPILALIIFLVILVVKSSLALSLGLVGALSIVRFRTPIKEPEELVYLFLAIAIGLGFGAGFTIITTAVVLSILLITYVFLCNKRLGSSSDFNLILTWKIDTVSYSDIIDTCSSMCESVALIRISDSQVEKSCVLSVMLTPEAKIDHIVSALNVLNADIDINMHQANTNW